MIIIFWEFLLFCETFLSPQVKRHVIISNKYGIKSFTHELPKNVRLRKLGNIKEISKRHTAIAMPPKKARPKYPAHDRSPQHQPPNWANTWNRSLASPSHSNHWPISTDKLGTRLPIPPQSPPIGNAIERNILTYIFFKVLLLSALLLFLEDFCYLQKTMTICCYSDLQNL